MGCDPFKKCRKQFNEPFNNQDDALLPSDITSTSSKSSTSSELPAKLEDFKRLKVLGKGSFGKVVQVELTKNKKIFAMKIVEKKVVLKRKQVDHIKAERFLLEKLNHPFIIKLIYAFQDEQKLYFITEFANGGELFFHLKRNPPYKDKSVIFYASEIICAIEYMHGCNYIYRDLKPENILFDKFGHVKLADFGLSKILDEDEKTTHTKCGTAEYLAPEVMFEKGYDKTCDWFSLGVVLFEMLTAKHPFKRKNQRFSPSTYTQPLSFPPSVSANAKDLIIKLLNPNPRVRLGYNGAHEIKSHPYFKGINFDLVFQKQYKPPFVPKISSDYDLKYFDIGFTSENVESLPKRREAYSDFEGFSYQPQDV